MPQGLNYGWPKWTKSAKGSTYEKFHVKKHTRIKTKPRSRAIRVQTSPIALEFDRHLGNSAVEMPVKCQSDTIIMPPNLTASRLTA